MARIEAPLLAVDLGNSAAKVAVYRSAVLKGRVVRVATEDGRTARAALTRLFRSLRPRPAAALVASVRPDLDAALSAAARSALGIDPLFLLREVRPPLKLLVRSVQTLGADRVAAAAGARALSGLDRRDIVVLDCGSAVTCDAVTRRGEFRGGAIAPGLGLAARALHEFTAALPLVLDAGRRRSPRAIGRDTREALESGLVHGMRGLVAGLVAEISRGLVWPALVATGGDARLLAPDGARVDPALTLGGLAATHFGGAVRAASRV